MVHLKPLVCIAQNGFLKKVLIKSLDKIDREEPRENTTREEIWKRTQFLDLMLRTLSNQPYIVLNWEHGFTCLGCTLGYWLDKYRLWTRNLDATIIYLLQLLLHCLKTNLDESTSGRVAWLWPPILSKIKFSSSSSYLFVIFIFLTSSSYLYIFKLRITSASIGWNPFALREKCPNTELFLVRIFVYSVQIQENTDQKQHGIWTLFTLCCSHHFFSFLTEG